MLEATTGLVVEFGWSGLQDTELPILYKQSLAVVVAVVVSLYVAADMRWSGVYEGHVTDVSRTGMCTVPHGWVR